MTEVEVNPANMWRVETPGVRDWSGSARPGDAKKYFIVSADTHLSPPLNLYAERIDSKFKDRLPRIEVRDGVQFMIVDGARPAPLQKAELAGEDKVRQDLGRGAATEEGVDEQLRLRIEHQIKDGVDAEVLYPNGPALSAYWTPDPEFAHAQFEIYNTWAAEATRPYRDRLNVAASISTANIDVAVAEIQRCAKLGYRVIGLPNRPIIGPPVPRQINYNHKSYDPMWAAIQDADLTIAFHISTGSDPRAASGPGGAIVNFAVHALPTALEPIANICVSGVLERFPKLRFSAVECGGGWLPWFLDTMDEGYRKHHHWVSPKLGSLPSDYFRAHGGVTFGEDRPAMMLVEEYGLVDNMMWANDYPHHEGTWPHSAEAIEREMGGLREDTRVKLLGVNAARMFRIDIPEIHKASAH